MGLSPSNKVEESSNSFEDEILEKFVLTLEKRTTIYMKFFFSPKDKLFLFGLSLSSSFE